MKNKRKKIWVCLKCGKQSNDKLCNDTMVVGWDSSCECNLVEVYKDEIVFVNDKVMGIRKNIGD